MNVLAESINDRGWSISKAAKIANLPYSTVYDLVSGRREIKNATYNTLESLANVLEMRVAELVGVDDVTGTELLTHDENELLSIYRSLSPFGKNTILLLARQLKSELAQ